MTTPNDTALLVLQGAVYDRLTGDAALALELGGDGPGIYDDVPEDRARPYVVLGEAVETPDNEVSAFGSRAVLTLHVWSDHRGYSEALRIAGHLMRLLDRQPLTVPGRGLVAVRHEQTVTMRDADLDVRHVAVRFAFETYPTT